MIKKLQLIKNLGKYYNYCASGDGFEWLKNTVIYACNGYGKTTITSIFRSLSTKNSDFIIGRKTIGKTEDQEIKLQISDKWYTFKGKSWEQDFLEGQSIFVFDNRFISENVFSDKIQFDHKAELHKVILGKESVLFAKEIEKLKSEERELKAKLKILDQAFLLKGITSFSVMEYVNIQLTNKKDLISKLEKTKALFKTKKKEAEIKRLTKPTNLNMLIFDINSIKSASEKTLDSTHIVAKEKFISHINDNCEHKSSAEEFIRLGLDQVKKDCPFCGQTLETAQEIMESYHNLFNAEYKAFENEIADAVQKLKEWNIQGFLASTELLHEKNKRHCENWRSHIENLSFPNELAALAPNKKEGVLGLKEKVLNSLENKQKNLSGNLEVEGINELAHWLEIFNVGVEWYNTALNKINQDINLFLERFKGTDIGEIQTTLNKLNDLEKRMEVAEIEWCKSYLAYKKSLDDTAKKRQENETNLSKNTSEVFSRYEDRINTLLEEEFNAEFKLSNFSSKLDKRANRPFAEYGIKILNTVINLKNEDEKEPHFKNTLSEGDKGTLAFALFIAYLENQQNLSDAIVIFDDPLSSLDDNRRLATVDALKNISEKSKQLIVLTHKKDFLHMLFSKLPKPKIFTLRSDKVKGSRIEKFDIESDMEDRHHKLIKRMKKYIKEDDGEETTKIQGDIRIVIEDCILFKYKTKLNLNRNEMTLGKMLEKLFSQDILLDQKEDLFDLCNLSTSPHHGDIQKNPLNNLERDELIPKVQKTLKVLEKI